MRSEVTLFTDGACSGNPGSGGWCAILKCGGHEKIISGGESATTNNRMELTAVIEGLKALKRRCVVTVVTDSKYVSDSVLKGWLFKWNEMSFKRKGGEVPNKDLWIELLGLLERHDVEFQWIKGHAGHKENEMCDKIAVEESLKRAKK